MQLETKYSLFCKERKANGCFVLEELSSLASTHANVHFASSLQIGTTCLGFSFWRCPVFGIGKAIIWGSAVLAADIA